jgi:hypothetical protein
MWGIFKILPLGGVVSAQPTEGEVLLIWPLPPPAFSRLPPGGRI